MPKYPKGILGVRKDPKNQILFSFSARQGDEWPSDDDEDSDYKPGKGSDSDNEGASTSKQSQKRKIKHTKTKRSTKKKVKQNNDKCTDKRTRPNNTRDHDHPAFHGEVPSLPTEIWEKIFKIIVQKDGALPFLERASKVCKLWKDISVQPHLWEKVDMSFGWMNLNETALRQYVKRLWA
ncbi:F-box/LRR-repeat protein 6-like, partial [Ruditapes philippinarum]|uniref:F-box/LRR-repeat protein 6-like n=1 Tax=Ruditapes philippinarum TaxID=129788 RepID=UPI00295B3604